MVCFSLTCHFYTTKCAADTHVTFIFNFMHKIRNMENARKDICLKFGNCLIEKLWISAANNAENCKKCKILRLASKIFSKKTRKFSCYTKFSVILYFLCFEVKNSISNTIVAKILGLGTSDFYRKICIIFLKFLILT